MGTGCPGPGCTELARSCGYRLPWPRAYGIALALWVQGAVAPVYGMGPALWVRVAVAPGVRNWPGHALAPGVRDCSGPVGTGCPGPRRTELARPCGRRSPWPRRHGVAVAPGVRGCPGPVSTTLPRPARTTLPAPGVRVPPASWVRGVQPRGRPSCRPGQGVDAAKAPAAPGVGGGGAFGVTAWWARTRVANASACESWWSGGSGREGPLGPVRPVTSELSPGGWQPWWPAPTSCWRRRSCG